MLITERPVIFDNSRKSPAHSHCPKCTSRGLVANAQAFILGEVRHVTLAGIEITGTEDARHMTDSRLHSYETGQSWPDFRIDDQARTLATLCFSGDSLHPNVAKRAQIIKQALLEGALEIQELPPDHELSTRSFPGTMKQRYSAVLRDFLTERTVADLEADLKCPPEVVPFLFEVAQAINLAAANDRMGGALREGHQSSGTMSSDRIQTPSSRQPVL